MEDYGSKTPTPKVVSLKLLCLCKSGIVSTSLSSLVPVFYSLNQTVFLITSGVSHGKFILSLSLRLIFLHYFFVHHFYVFVNNIGRVRSLHRYKRP